MKNRNLTIAFMTLMILGIISTFVLFYFLKQAELNNEKTIIQLNKTEDSLTMVTAQIEKQKNDLQLLRDSLSLRFPDEVEAIEENIESDEYTYRVGINYNSDNADLTKLVNYMNSNQKDFFIYFKKPKQVQKSYIIYYNNELKDIAESLKNMINENTGLGFETTKGLNASSVSEPDKTFIVQIK